MNKHCLKTRRLKISNNSETVPLISTELRELEMKIRMKKHLKRVKMVKTKDRNLKIDDKRTLAQNSKNISRKHYAA